MDLEGLYKPLPTESNKASKTIYLIEILIADHFNGERAAMLKSATIGREQKISQEL